MKRTSSPAGLEQPVPPGGPHAQQSAMATPWVNPVGILEHPAGYGSARRHPPVVRWLAGVFVVLFFAVTVISSAVTLGAYCLTSDAGDTRALRSTVFDRSE